MTASTVRLFKEAPENNVHRAYTIEVMRNLLGEWLVVRRWGRIGTRGQRREHVCASHEEANALAAKLVHERRRRGYRGERASQVRAVVVDKPVQRRRRARVPSSQLALWAPLEERAAATARAHTSSRAVAKPCVAPTPEGPRGYERQLTLDTEHYANVQRHTYAANASPTERSARIVYDAVESAKQRRIAALVELSAQAFTRHGEPLQTARASSLKSFVEKSCERRERLIEGLIGVPRKGWPMTRARHLR